MSSVSGQLKEKIPDIIAVNIPLEDAKTGIVFISIKKTKPYHAKIIAEDIFKLIPDFIKILIVLDNGIAVSDISTIMWKLFNNVDPKRDFYFLNGKLAIDATRKLKEEGHFREWPPEISMDDVVKKKVDAMDL
ncbi:MAG: UbiD family decarboxylase [Nitrospinae bacterium]|nr:UbiD family decarboxylase [Nitrospinota bacterium]